MKNKIPVVTMLLILVIIALATDSKMRSNRDNFIRKFTPMPGSTISDVEEKIGLRLNIEECIIGEKVYKIATAPFAGEVARQRLLSGSPMYVFNEKGMLIDYAVDSGENPPFQERWKAYWRGKYEKKDVFTR